MRRQRQPKRTLRTAMNGTASLGCQQSARARARTHTHTHTTPCAHAHTHTHTTHTTPHTPHTSHHATHTHTHHTHTHTHTPHYTHTHTTPPRRNCRLIKHTITYKYNLPGNNVSLSICHMLQPCSTIIKLCTANRKQNSVF